LSDYYTWEQLGHANEWILFPKNIGPYLSIDETSLSNGELYTILTSKEAKGKKGVLIAMIKGTSSNVVCKILNIIPLNKRLMVKEVTIDMANCMEKIIRTSFPSATIVTDRFHVQQLIGDAIQEMRIKLRWIAIEEENKAIKLAKQKNRKYIPYTYSNGDTKKQLLARSRYLLFKPSNKWIDSQRARAKILFKLFPMLEKAYNLSLMFSSIYHTSKDRNTAIEGLNQWYEKVQEKNFESFITAANSIKNHQETILNFFINRSTNASAESFNAKIKAFRATFRGVRDTAFFLFRVAKIYA
jgi:transposase